MNCLVDGNIPPSSGLSSSSALVCCAGLVTVTVLGMNLSKVTNLNVFASQNSLFLKALVCEAQNWNIFLRLNNFVLPERTPHMDMHITLVN